jgi:hypothetical protein
MIDPNQSPDFDVDVDADREREEALREQMYIEYERAELEADELGIELPYECAEQDELEDIPF